MMSEQVKAINVTVHSGKLGSDDCAASVDDCLAVAMNRLFDAPFDCDEFKLKVESGFHGYVFTGDGEPSHGVSYAFKGGAGMILTVKNVDLAVATADDIRHQLAYIDGYAHGHYDMTELTELCCGRTGV